MPAGPARGQGARFAPLVLVAATPGALTQNAYRYRPGVLQQLLKQGVRPVSSTPPAVVRVFLNDLYRYELRRLRDRLLKGEIEKPDYAGHVIELRERYALLSLPVSMWTF